jgi:hypothetical protein
VSGRLVAKSGHYILTDETTNVTFEITGPGLKKQDMQRVELTGYLDPTATPVSEATQVIRLTGMNRLGAGAAAAGAGGAAAGGGGLSGLAISGTTIAIIGGVAAAAVVGGLAAAGSFSSAQTVSR